MKITIVLAALCSAALAAPALDADAATVDRRVPAPCDCEPVFCPLELIAECRCKRAAAIACYEAALATGAICAKPMITCPGDLKMRM